MTSTKVTWTAFLQRKITINHNHSIEYQIAGTAFRIMEKGDTILLLHGKYGSPLCWRDIAPMLVEAGFEVICPDIRELYEPGCLEVEGPNLQIVESVRMLLRAERVTNSVHLIGMESCLLTMNLYAVTHASEVKSLTCLVPDMRAGSKVPSVTPRLQELELSNYEPMMDGVFPNCGHLVAEERPQELLAILVPFFKEI